MWEALTRLGVSPGETVLEPGCGPGRFFALAPEGMRFIGVELDQVSGRIAKLSPAAVRLAPPAAMVGVRGTRVVTRGAE